MHFTQGGQRGHQVVVLVRVSGCAGPDTACWVASACSWSNLFDYTVNGRFDMNPVTLPKVNRLGD